MIDHDLFSTETAGLAEVSGPQLIRLADGDRYGLSIGPVRKDLGGELAAHPRLGAARLGRQRRALPRRGNRIPSRMSGRQR